MKLIIAEIERCIDGFEWLEIDVELALFIFVSYNFSDILEQIRLRDIPTEYNKTIRRNSSVELQPLLRRRDSTQYRESIDTRLYVRSCSIFLS